MTDLATTWATIAGAAMLLDPDTIRATIRSTLDDGLRAANYDGVGGRSAEVSSHPERVALNPRKDSSWADLDLIDHHVARFVAAVAELAARSRSGRPCADWEEAVQDAHLLAEMDAVSVLDASGQRPARWVHQAGDAVHDLELIARRHRGGRAPTEDEKHWDRDNPNDLCAWHTDIAPRGSYRRPRLPGLNICDACRTLAEMGDRKPPTWLLEAEVERDAKPRAWTAALSRYADELGIRRDRSA